MGFVRGAALYAVLPLALVVGIGYGWYWLSDTGKEWRYEDRLAEYCGGLIPLEESAAFTHFDRAGLSRDMQRGYGHHRFSYCRVADMTLIVGLLPHDARPSGSGLDDIFSELSSAENADLPLPLGGGWHGYTNMLNTSIVLSCSNRPASGVVTFSSDQPHEDSTGARAAGEFAAATASKAANRFLYG
ncbi:hypothetical protein [Streptomyces sp. NPDC054866]